MGYRWDNISEWLEWSVEQEGGVTLDDLLRFIRHIDDDQIQDFFQSWMDSDGYFEDNWDRDRQETVGPADEEEEDV